MSKQYQDQKKKWIQKGRDEIIDVIDNTSFEEIYDKLPVICIPKSLWDDMKLRWVEKETK